MMKSENDATKGTKADCRRTWIGDEAGQVPGVIRTLIDNEIAAGLARLRLSREELLAEADLYPWVAEWPEIYDHMLTSTVARTRAVELLEFLIIDGESTAGIDDLDIGIDELRDVLPLASPNPPSPEIQRQLKEGAKEEEAA
jgi:hypothetical protein